MKGIRYFIFALPLILQPAIVSSQGLSPEDIAAIDTSGPPFNPAQIKVNEAMKNFSECSFIDWKGQGLGAGTPEVIHNFDRQWDSERLFHLMEMSEDLSKEWMVARGLFNEKKEQIGEWSRDNRDSKNKFITAKTLKKLRADGYLLQFKPFIKFYGSGMGEGKLTKVPN